MTLQTEHRGYTIRYDQNRDAWGCYDCGIQGEPTLSKAKEKIDKLHLKMRKAAAYPCYEIAGAETAKGFEVRATEAMILDYLGRKENRSWSTREVEFVGHRVASMAQRNGNEKKSRQEKTLHDLAPESPEVHAQIEKANRLGKIAHEAALEFRAAVKAIPRVPFEDIAGLVEASEHKFEEGENG